ncbi:multisubstrate pseudouridine synthase 7 isoform X2 [Vitis riparia]|uniref:multisubstrate pseudouridine synthase 7 isoform X2 n=1 Tax=Vitis riparia TaxID=96939 RepID=UPI00155AE77E|nr:multisubstrate pseudouridine synthase 7 isoform X2 [Vitis riparia]
MKHLEESDVGISFYISQLPGFRGILKQRYCDFIVNEVDSDGNVVHLTSLDAPPESMEKNETKISDQSNKGYASEIELFRSLVGDSDAECLKGLIDQVASGIEDGVSPIVLSPSSDKSHRTAVHNFFKENLKFLVTDTIDGPDTSSKCIRVRLNSGGSHNNGRNSRKRKDRRDKPFDSRGSDNWSEHVGKFLRFHLYKENKDTQEAIGLIGKMLGIQPRSFGFAGTKDKRSVSTQRVTVFKQYANRLAALNERLIGIKVGDFCHVREGLVLGQLLGNRFTITLRGVVADSEETIKASADALGRLGFINYFGLQRFGSGSVPTHLIGAALLRGEWETAVSLILDPREGERDAIRKAREYYKESDDIEGTLRQFPRHLVAEKAILQCLKKYPGNYLQALKAIPRTLRMMYVHSYQSYLWNHAASMRVQKYGTKQVVLGDLVYCKGDNAEKETRVVNSEFDDDGCSDAFDSSHFDEISETDLPEERKDPVKDAISLTESVHSVKEFSITNMTGGFRRVFQKPIDFEWELLTYTEGNIPLAETDWDKITKSKPLNIIGGEDLRNGNEKENSFQCMKQSESFEHNVNLSTDNNEPNGVTEIGLPQVEPQFESGAPEAQRALKLSFTLPASCYATMAIRELLKTSTSVAFQKTLNTLS